MSFLTTNQGAPIEDNQNSRTADQRGPVLLEDYQFIEKLAHVDQIDQTNDFAQAGQVWRRLSKEEQDAVVKHIANEIKGADERTVLLALCNFFRADMQLGQRLADALQIDISSYVQQLQNM